MRIDDILARKGPTFSFEFMAPRTEDEVEKLFETVSDLATLKPDFVCVTCRPSSRNVTVELVTRIQQRLGIVAMAHLICAGSSKLEITGMLDRLGAAGVENVLALRGDIPAGGEIGFADGLEHGSDLASLIARRGDMCIGGACYPEKHPDSATLGDDLANTALKVRSGASFLITQLFFDSAAYFKFAREAFARGISAPILPGIMPITHFKQLARVKEMGATVPPKFEATLVRYQNEPNAIREIGIAWASIQCVELLDAGAPGIHFYTFNRSPATRALHGALRAMGHSLDRSREKRSPAV
jgi:methylenetetrahydrofolate reductase (NADPH)